MSNAVFTPQPKVISEAYATAVLQRWDETRESLAQFWLANPAMAKQGGIEVEKLLSPDNEIWLQQHELSKYS